MITEEQVAQFRNMLANAESVIVAYGENASVDELAAAVGLAEGMALLGKSIRLASPKVAQSDLISGLDKTVTELGHENLVVSFDYTQEAVANVSYHISEDNQKFFLTIKPKKGELPLNTSSIKCEYTGTQADMVLVVGVEEYEKLKQIYFGYEDVFRDATVIPFATYPSYQSRFSFASMGRSSLSEVAGDLLHQLEVEFTENLATNLLRGIEWSTDKIQAESATADTFEIISKLLRAGAKRTQLNTAQVDNSARASTSPISTTPKPILGNTNSLRDALQKTSQTQITQPVVQATNSTTPPTQPVAQQPQKPHNQQSNKKKKRRRKKSTQGRSTSGRKKSNNQPGGLNYTPSGHSVSGA